MVIIIYSLVSEKSIKSKVGLPDYSYYFVLKEYRKILCNFADVVEIRDPESEVDVIYNDCCAKGVPCIFLSFTPPFKTATELKCPTISVFAWEYSTIPTEVWGNDARNDWRTVFRKHGCTITHSSFAVRTVQKEMGNDFPVWSIPAPVWDDNAKLYGKGKASAQSPGFDLSFKGVLIDFQGCPAAFAIKECEEGFIEQQSSQEEDAEINIHLEGIIYTTVFNPNDARKNWPDLLWGFCWAFRDVQDVTLVMKLVYYDFEIVRAAVLDEVKKVAPFKCRVVFLNGYLNDDEYAKLIRESTYVVNTARGEGQCLPLMEYMSAGKPAIAPAHTSMEDYINERNAFIIGSSLRWCRWPHSSIEAFSTFTNDINWESLYYAYLESYQVAKNDPIRYARMSKCAVSSLKKYCSKAVVAEKLKQVFIERGLIKE